VAIDFPTGNETVLLVEDETIVRNFAVKALTQQGFNVYSAVDGADALKIAEGIDGDIHILVTDVVMPEMNGRTLAEKMLLLRPATKVIYASGYNEDSFIQEGVREDNIVFLQKPYTHQMLAQKVRDVLDNV